MKSRLIFIVAVLLFVVAVQLPWRWNRLYRAMGQVTPTSVSTANLVKGLTLKFSNATGTVVDAREARLIALTVPAGTAASPFTAPGSFIATWTGVLTTRIKDTYRFAAEGRGELTVTLNDKQLLNLHGDLGGLMSEPILLRKGKNRLVVTYRSPAPTADGDATVRLMWAASGAPMEPISPAVFMHDASEEILVKSNIVRTGRELVGTLRCVACHQGVSGSMPELKQDAPNLSGIKSRLNSTWMAYWISNPKLLRPTASMPCLFHDLPATVAPVVDKRAGDIAAYLGDESEPAVVENNPDMLARGARLYTGLGCVACHVAPDIPDSDPTLNRVPLKYVKAKFKPEALREFLRKPEAHYAWIKMPNFRLSEPEVNAISGWLLSRCKDDALPAVTGKFDAVNGKKLFETSGCMSCHTVDGSQPMPALGSDLAHADFSKGCLADEVAAISKGVDFGLSAEQRAAIRAFAAVDWKGALSQDSPMEFASRAMNSLRCIACHSIDGADNLWSNLDTDIGAIEQGLPARAENDPEPRGDQSRPPLTWVGEKLRPGWMTAFISGKIGYKPRPWVFARMPGFASRAQMLSRGMAQAHGCAMEDETRPAVDEKLAEIGRNLTSQTSFGCVKCHAVGDQAALAPFEAEAPNLAHVQDRLRHEYFTHWMRNPQYYLPGTKMPSFANGGGKTPYKDVLNGDAAAEYEAIWNYLRAGDGISPTQ